MTEFLLFNKGDRVRASAAGRAGQLGTVKAFERDSESGQPVRWRVALDDGGTWLFLTNELEHVEGE